MYKRYARFSLVILVVVALLLPGGGALAQSGEGYDLSWWTVDGGGITAAGAESPGPYTLSGTAGQPDAGPTLSNSGYVLTGGFWAGVRAASVPGANAIYLPLVIKSN